MQLAVDALVADLEARVGGSGRRVLLAIVGAPGAGKSTLATRVAGSLPAGRSVVVPMDGFHLSGRVLAERGLADRKGAIETFDAGGLLALLRRIAADDGSTVLAPEYVRGLDEPIAASIPVPPSARIVIVEGNYLLSELSPWDEVRGLIDEAWYLEVPDALRIERLVARHERFGRSHEDAVAWANTVDQPNADYIVTTRSRADKIIRL